MDHIHTDPYKICRALDINMSQYFILECSPHKITFIQAKKLCDYASIDLDTLYSLINPND